MIGHDDKRENPVVAFSGLIAESVTHGVGKRSIRKDSLASVAARSYEVGSAVFGVPSLAEIAAVSVASHHTAILQEAAVAECPVKSAIRA